MRRAPPRPARRRSPTLGAPPGTPARSGVTVPRALPAPAPPCQVELGRPGPRGPGTSPRPARPARGRGARGENRAARARDRPRALLDLAPHARDPGAPRSPARHAGRPRREALPRLGAQPPGPAAAPPRACAQGARDRPRPGSRSPRAPARRRRAAAGHAPPRAGLRDRGIGRAGGPGRQLERARPGVRLPRSLHPPEGHLVERGLARSRATATRSSRNPAIFVDYEIPRTSAALYGKMLVSARVDSRGVS